MNRTFGIAEFLYILAALRWTLLLSLIAFLGGGVVGFVVAILRTTQSRALRLLTAGYIQLFQGTPVLMQLFLFYYGLAVLYDVQVDAWPAVTLAFTLYAGAFLGEIWRGSIQAIPRTQWEASAIDCRHHRLRRTDSGGTAHGQCDLPAHGRIPDRGGSVFRRVLAAFLPQPDS